MNAVVDDDFARADTNPGTVTGPAMFSAPSTGAAYTDAKGATWAITRDTLAGVALNTGDYSSAYLLRPAGENFRDGATAITVVTGSATSAAQAVTRYNGSQAYCASFFQWGGGNGIIRVAILDAGNGAFTDLGSTHLSGLDPAAAYVVTVTDRGANPTALTATVALASAPSAILGTATASDGTTGLQVAGQRGLSANTQADSPVRVLRFVTSQAAALAIGALSAMATQNGVTLTLAAGMSGVSGAGYAIDLHRPATPLFTPGPATLLATVSPDAMPYTDLAAPAKTQLFYAAVGRDGAGASVAAIPVGLGPWTPGYAPTVSAKRQTQGLNVVFIGDSNTFGQNLPNAGTVLSPTMPFFFMRALRRSMGLRGVAGVNCGHSGHTLTDFTPGGGDYGNAKAAMDSLMTSQPAWLPLFVILLGANDSAASGTNNGTYAGSLPASAYTAKMQGLVSQLLTDFPACKVVVNVPGIPYSPNFRGNRDYTQGGVDALFSYRAACAVAIDAFATSDPGRVLTGDTYAWEYFSANCLTELQAESNANGIQYGHLTGFADAATGLIGTQTYGEMAALAVARALYA